MITYLLKSSLCLLLLWGFYKIFLEQENMHTYKRFFLLGSLVFSFVIPLVTFTYTIDLEPTTVIIPEKPSTIAVPSVVALSDNTPVNYMPIILWSLYSLGVLIFGIRFIKNIIHLIKTIKRNTQLEESSHTNVLVKNSIVPFTFLHYIFMNKKDYEEHKIPEEVLLHEKTHVLQKHTLDILCIEILQVVFWFNPLLICMKRSIKLNHEFLADQTVLKCNPSIQKYMGILVDYIGNSNQVELASPIHYSYSLTKKRIVMMSQQFSKIRALARLLLLMPTLLGCVLLFTNKIVAQQSTLNYQKSVQDTHPDKKIEIKVKGDRIEVNGDATTISNFSKTIDDVTQQWSDEELTEFQFSIQLNNVDDEVLKQLNEAYRKTRLYRANPDGHDLIPPPPTPPHISTKNANLAPVPPLKSEESQTTKNSMAPVPPVPPSPPVAPSNVISGIKDEMKLTYEEAEQDRIEAEQARVEAEIEREKASLEAAYELANAMNVAEIARQAAASSREMVMQQLQQVQQQAHQIQEEAMRQAQLSRVEARKVRDLAMQEAQLVRQKLLQERAQIREEVRQAAESAKREAIKEHKKAIAKIKKARKKIEKEQKKTQKDKN
ncbi:hypothetical protein J8281_06205 [Aquimarina sp. U1-2]|uniref:M56 family metallopeptidase n=1 Tax=Aquimarina sp. U1-2 TaxID=2823141 RepID=UPI001AEC804F|nr:M56 family metallopeptidase [Aquimarina sp. U1-2]MBP2831777.1 hypothetical protein [Aquimarina sp. U1-2]